MLDAAVFRGQNLFALRVKGESMKDVGILDGDLAICEPRQYAQNGEIVVALINNEEATVKRFFLRKNHIELRPENTDYSPMRYGFERNPDSGQSHRHPARAGGDKIMAKGIESSALSYFYAGGLGKVS